MFFFVVLFGCTFGRRGFLSGDFLRLFGDFRCFLGVFLLGKSVNMSIC